MSGPSDPRLETQVYRPAADSTLLVEAAKQVLDPGWIVVDTGTGSGIVADRLQREAAVRAIATDINPHACAAASRRGLEVVRGSLLDPIDEASVDAAVFNPPYLPADDRLPDDWLDRATTGGPTGIELVSDWIEDVPRVLKPGGVAVCLVSSLTDIDEVVAIAEATGLSVTELAERPFPFERLVALALNPAEPSAVDQLA